MTAPRRSVGFTLVEVTMMSVVLVVIGTAVAQSYLAFSMSVDTINALGPLQMQLSLAADTLSRDIQQSSEEEPSCVPPVCTTTFVRDFDSAGDGVATFILMMPTSTATGPILNPTTTFDRIVYTYTFDVTTGTGVLRRRIFANDAAGSRFATAASEPDQDLVVARYLQRFTFDRALYPTIRFTLEGRKLEHGRTYTKSITVRGKLRNGF